MLIKKAVASCSFAALALKTARPALSFCRKGGKGLKIHRKRVVGKYAISVQKKKKNGYVKIRVYFVQSSLILHARFDFELQLVLDKTRCKSYSRCSLTGLRLFSYIHMKMKYSLV